MEKNNKYLENYIGRQFTEQDFVVLILHLLYQKGVYIIDEIELEKKLFYYYKNKEFNELFQDIAIENLPSHKAVCLTNGFYRAKFFDNILWSVGNNDDLLRIGCNPDVNLALYEQKLSADGKIKIGQIAQEIAVRYKAEQKSSSKLNIYGTNPNSSYQIFEGKNHGNLLGFELITDGSILTIDKQDIRGMEHYYYESPYKSNEAIQLEDNVVINVALQDATYAIKQGICDDKVCYSNVFTQSLDEDTLEEIVKIANQGYKEKENVLTREAPFIRKLRLK